MAASLRNFTKLRHQVHSLLWLALWLVARSSLHIWIDALRDAGVTSQLLRKNPRRCRQTP
jgi:hypothetical protein